MRYKNMYALGLAGILAGLLTTTGLAAQPEVLSLSGHWRFQLDRGTSGVQEKWFERSLPDRITLPGSLPEQGIGDEISVDTRWTGDIVDKTWFTAPEYAPYRERGNVKVPFWLQPDKYYAGAAWYQRDIEIPARWKGKRVVLSLERPHWETRVWIDGREVGSQTGLSTPHEYNLGAELTEGKHRLTIRVDNSVVVDVGVNSHCITDHTQGNWNGIVGDISLRATEPVWLEDLQVYPSFARKVVRVAGKLGNISGRGGSGMMVFAVEEQAGNRDKKAQREQRVSWQTGGGTFEFEIPMPDAEPWSEFEPARYNLTASLGTQQKTVPFGFRDLSANGTQFTLNGTNIFIRGTLECCIFPRTGHPPTDVESWARIIKAAKAHGLNLFRFHSYCPPEAAFAAADRLGFYLQVETCWANSSTTIGDGKPVDQWVYDETDQILKAYGNHPSFILMPYGNEPGGDKANAYLAKYVEHFKTKDPRRLWTSGAGWPQLKENQWHLTPDPRIQSWGGGMNSRINARPPETITDYREYIQQRSVPVVSHEIGQWCVFPNFDEIPKYTGYLKPKNFEIFRESLRAHHMWDLAHRFLLASGKLQTLCYKEEIESALRTPGMGGFELLDLHDFPGQGTALVGVLDPFWESKGYVTAKEYSRFCNSTVPLARLARRVFTTEDTLDASVEAAHFGPVPLRQASARWKLVGAKGKQFAGGQFPAGDLNIGNCNPLGRLAIPLAGVPAPAQYKLVVSVSERSANARSRRSAREEMFENDWDVWVYPARLDTLAPEGITVASELDDSALALLEAGGKVLLNIPPERVKGDRHGKVALGFSSIFWNTAWTGRQPPHTLGILCDPKHPALAGFPTEYHSNWQWWYIISRSGAVIMDDLPQELRPTVQVIDDWVTNRKLGLVFEAKVGRGKLLVCSAALAGGSEPNPVMAQFRHSLLAYMASSKFKPAVSVTPEQVRGLMTKPSAMQRQGARVVKVDSAQPGFEAEKAIDGNPATFWHTAWDAPAPGFPHEIQVRLETPARVRGLSLLPRQDGNRNGWIKDYELYISADGQSWGEPVAKGAFSADDQEKAVFLAGPLEVRFVRLVALSGYQNGPWASLAEFGLIE